MFKKKLKVVTHDGNFHADDVFATAALQILFEKRGQRYEIFRSRDKEFQKNADFLYDTGYIYDLENNRFDHHQEGGAGGRENGIQYSSLGLIWKHFGEEITGTRKSAEIVDTNFISTVDYHDNGNQQGPISGTNTYLYSIDNLIKSFNPLHSEQNQDDFSNMAAFNQALSVAQKVLAREIKKAKESEIEYEKVLDLYNKAEDKRIIVSDEHLSHKQVLCYKPEPLHFIYPKYGEGWGISPIPVHPKSKDLRNRLPEDWGGLTGKELEDVSGVEGARFCHRTGFLGVAKTKESAIKMARKSLEIGEKRAD